MKRLFGTDGVRGIANKEVTCSLAYAIGRAITHQLSQGNQTPVIAIGKDPRISSDMLENALTSGILSAGGNVLKLGVIPTPAVSLLTKQYQCDGGVMISASHNPAEYNGIKLFDKTGMKFPDDIEDAIEELTKKEDTLPTPTGTNVGAILPCRNAKEDYIQWLCSAVSVDFSGMKIALDCANGATSKIAEEVFWRLGAEVFATGNHPDGLNINQNCGSTFMSNICSFTKETDADFGISFDGDGDRALFCDESGQEVDGDCALAIFSYYMKQQNTLERNTLVATVMSNLGLSLFAKEHGISILSTKVGDRYVWEALQKGGFSLGGEQSGHIIFPQYAVTGDGILTALKMAEILAKTKSSLREVSQLMQKLPQVLYNVKITKEAVDKIPNDSKLTAMVERIQSRLGDRGRVLLRPSGTEPLYRVMLEGESPTEIAKSGQEIVTYLQTKYPLP